MKLHTRDELCADIPCELCESFVDCVSEMDALLTRYKRAVAILKDDIETGAIDLDMINFDFDYYLAQADKDNDTTNKPLGD